MGSQEFKDIIQAMLQLDPAHRPSIPEVLAHPWMKGPIPTYEEVHAEFTERESKVREAMEAEKLAKEEEKTRQMDHRRQVNMRSGGQKSGIDVSKQFDNSDDSLFKPQKALEEYERIFGQNSEFFSTYNPDMIEDALLDNLRQQGVEPYKKNKDKYKLKFTFCTKD